MANGQLPANEATDVEAEPGDERRVHLNWCSRSQFHARMTDESLLPSHVQKAVEAIAEMHAAHHREASRWERATDRIIAAVGRPQALIVAGLVVGLWIWGALRPSFWPDRPPFALLDFALGVIAILLSVLILASQRRADRLHQRRQQMALEVALFGRA